MKSTRWVTRLIGLAVLIVLLLVLKLVQGQFEKLVHRHQAQGAGSTSAPDSPEREGDVPADAIW